MYDNMYSENYKLHEKIQSTRLKRQSAKIEVIVQSQTELNELHNEKTELNEYI